jgi:hypothetical protein
MLAVDMMLLLLEGEQARLRKGADVKASRVKTALHEPPVHWYRK